MRNIKIYTSNGKSGNAIQTDGKSLKDITGELSKLNINTNNMRLIVGETETELVSPDSVLPEGEFTLFLMQKESKAGAKTVYDRKALYGQIKDIIDKDAAAKQYFTVDGKNYTQVGSEKLAELIAAYTGSTANPAATVAAPAAPKKQKEDKPKAEPKKAKEEPKEEAASTAVAVQENTATVKAVETLTGKELIMDIVNSLSTMKVTEAAKEDVDFAVESLGQAVQKWDLEPKPTLNISEMEKKAQELSKKVSGLKRIY